MRLTAVGNELRRLGIEIASRPFYYVETPDLELQFFLNFTESTRYEVHYDLKNLFNNGILLLESHYLRLNH